MQCVVYVNEIAKKFTCVFRMNKFRGDYHFLFPAMLQVFAITNIFCEQNNV